MTSWMRAGPTFTLTTDRLSKSEAGSGDDDLQPAKLAMPVRSGHPLHVLTSSDLGSRSSVRLWRCFRAFGVLTPVAPDHRLWPVLKARMRHVGCAGRQGAGLGVAGDRMLCTGPPCEGDLVTDECPGCCKTASTVLFL